VFETVIALADEYAQRIERSLGKDFDDVPASDRVSRTEHEWLHAETERLITETFGADSPQMRYWRTTREADSKSAWDLFPNDQWRPWLYSMQRTAATLRTLDSQAPPTIRTPTSSQMPTSSTLSAESKSSTPQQAFISYTHRDARYAERLRTALAVLKSQGLVEDWHDRRIRAGAEWAAEIDQHLSSADLVLLLVTPDFLASDYAFGIEVTRALERHAQGAAVVVPVIVRACDWMHTPLGKLQAVPTDGKPIASWKNRDDAWLNVTDGIRGVVLRTEVLRNG
jgi:hypothetical protein